MIVVWNVFALWYTLWLALWYVLYNIVEWDGLRFDMHLWYGMYEIYCGMTCLVIENTL